MCVVKKLCNVVLEMEMDVDNFEKKQRTMCWQILIGKSGISKQNSVAHLIWVFTVFGWLHVEDPSFKFQKIEVCLQRL